MTPSWYHTVRAQGMCLKMTLTMTVRIICITIGGRQGPIVAISS